MKRLLLIIAMLLPLAAHAADPTASRSTFVKLMDVQEMWDEEDYDGAIAELEALIEKTRGKQPYDFAVANQYLAHTALMADQVDRARPALEAALSMPEKDLGVKLTGELKMFYAQIVIGDEDFELAKRMFDEWLEVTEEPPKPQQYFSMGYANYMAGYLTEAREYVTTAINQSPKPADNWLRLQYSILFDSKEFEEARSIAINLLDRDPTNESYWRLLASHYMRLEDYEQALATAETAMTAGVMTSETDLRRVASLYGHVAVPEKAARHLAVWLEEEKVEANAKTWRQLGDLWMLARERENAKDALWKSVNLEPDAKTFEFLASIHFEDEEWQRSYDAFEQALRLSDEEEEKIHRLEMLTGLTAMRAGHKQEAREFLMLAQSSNELRGQVRSILRELDKM